MYLFFKVEKKFKFDQVLIKFHNFVLTLFLSYKKYLISFFFAKMLSFLEILHIQTIMVQILSLHFIFF